MWAEFWIESTDSNEASPAGVLLYVATDQVRFYRGERPEFGADDEAPMALEEVPPLVFSEVMRDVDLFVGVCSIGADPAWTARAGDAGQRDFGEYWESFSFGELSAAAQVRGETLRRIVPRLKIGPRCSFESRYLVVRGELRTYKIHLGSGNILMAPDDQYLCIVEARSSAAEHVMLPFEGDRTLALILSKALLLADDTKIKDPSIVRQIEGR
jgi:hypothetical protein